MAYFDDALAAIGPNALDLMEQHGMHAVIPAVAGPTKSGLFKQYFGDFKARAAASRTGLPLHRLGSRQRQVPARAPQPRLPRSECSREPPPGPAQVFTADELKKLSDKGHEVVMHSMTHSRHLNVFTKWGIRGEVFRGTDLMRKLTPFASFQHYVYPYGREGRLSYVMLRDYGFKTARTVVNTGWFSGMCGIDLLRITISGPGVFRTTVKDFEWVMEAATKVGGGAVVLMLHGVYPDNEIDKCQWPRQPGQITATEFKSIVDALVKSNAQVVTVSEYLELVKQEAYCKRIDL